MQVTWSPKFKDYSEKAVDLATPEKPGIYLIFVSQNNRTSGRLIYVGQSENLRDRLVEHLSDNEPNEALRNHLSEHICWFQFTPITKQSERDGVESFLIRRLRPECNTQVPTYDPIEVNLP
jgi:excinuclease UvrABC nuclease subunit